MIEPPTYRPKPIQEGDNVYVRLLSMKAGGRNQYDIPDFIHGKVVSMPVATGDCWIIQAGDHIYHVQNFSYIARGPVQP